MGFKARNSGPLVGAGLSTPISFSAIYERAAVRKGGPSALESMLPSPKSNLQLEAISDDRYLAGMAKGIFRAGFVWSVVENKWPGFEEAFHNFHTLKMATMDSDDLEALAGDTRIIRNRPKIVAVRDNARFILEVVSEYGSFGKYIANWPSDNLIGLWSDLHKRGSRLGGFTRAYFLRELGKDTFILTSDVVLALVGAGVVDKFPSSKRDLAATQDAFNSWRLETGRPLCQLSRILSCSVGTNFLQ